MLSNMYNSRTCHTCQRRVPEVSACSQVSINHNTVKVVIVIFLVSSSLFVCVFFLLSPMHSVNWCGWKTSLEHLNITRWQAVPQRNRKCKYNDKRKENNVHEKHENNTRYWFSSWGVPHVSSTNPFWLVIFTSIFKFNLHLKETRIERMINNNSLNWGNMKTIKLVNQQYSTSISQMSDSHKITGIP